MLSGQLRPGDPFPSVRALSKAAKVHPNTAHKVIAQLTADGLLEVRPGIGTIVASPPKICTPPSTNTGGGWRREMARRHYEFAATHGGADQDISKNARAQRSD